MRKRNRTAKTRMFIKDEAFIVDAAFLPVLVWGGKQRGLSGPPMLFYDEVNKNPIPLDAILKHVKPCTCKGVIATVAGSDYMRRFLDG